MILTSLIALITSAPPYSQDGMTPEKAISLKDIR